MASTAATSISIPTQARSAPLRRQAVTGTFGVQSVSFTSYRGRFPSIQLKSVARRFCVSCAAKPETVDRVCAIVRKQLALAADTPLSGESKFNELGADSLDTVEIVMGFEEEFGISVEEESAQNIQTVQDAADMIEKLVAKKSG